MGATPESPLRVRKRRPSQAASTGSLHAASYAARSARVSRPPRSSESASSDSAIVPRVDARGALVGERLERRDEAGLLEPLAGAEQRAAGRVHPAALAHRHDRREHLEAGCVRRRQSHSVARKP